MKYFLTSLLVFGFVCQSFCQTRLTEYSDNGTNLKYRLITFEAQYYLLEFDQNDLLSVYEITEINERTLLHQRHIPGSFQTDNFNIYQQYLLYCQGNEVHKFDFITNETISYDIPSDLTLQSVSTDGNNTLLKLSGNNLDKYHYVIYDSSQDTFTYETESNLTINGSHLIERKTEQWTPPSVFIHNYLDVESDTLYHMHPLNYNIVMNGNIIYYLDETGQAYSYNLNDGTRILLNNLSVNTDSINTVQLQLNDDNLIIGHGTSTANGFKYGFIIYDLNTMQVAYNYEHIFERFVRSFELHENILYGQTVDATVFVFNLEDSNVFLTESWGVMDSLVNNKYIVYLSKEESELTLFDIESFETYSSGLKDFIYYMQEGSIASFEEDVMVHLDNHAYEDKDLIHLNLETFNAEFHVFDQTSNGFGQHATLHSFKSGVFISDYPTMYYKDNELLTVDSTWYWIDSKMNSDSSFIYGRTRFNNAIYRFDGQETDTFLISNVSSYIPTSNYIFYYDSENRNLYRYEIASNNTVLIEENVDRPLIQIIRYKLIFNNGENLYAVSENLDRELLIDNFTFSNVLKELPIDINGNTIIPSRSGLWSLTPENNLTLIQGGLNFLSPPHYLLPNEDKTQLIFGNRSTLYHYDGTSSNLIPTEHISSNPKFIGDNLLYMSSYNLDTQEQKHLYYNVKTKYLQEFDIAASNLFTNYFQVGQRDVLLGFSTMNNCNPRFYSSNIFETNEALENPNLLHSIPETIYNYTSEAILFKEHAIVTAGNSFLNIDNNLNVQVIENIKTKYGRAPFTILDEELYFLAYDPIYGRQLYSYDAGLLSVQKQESPVKNSSFQIYPNPSNNIIYINLAGGINKTKLNKDFRFKIFSCSGELLKQGELSDSVLIEDLSSGIYFIEILSEQYNQVQKFIKG